MPLDQIMASSQPHQFLRGDVLPLQHTNTGSPWYLGIVCPGRNLKAGLNQKQVGIATGFDPRAQYLVDPILSISYDFRFYYRRAVADPAQLVDLQQPHTFSDSNDPGNHHLDPLPDGNQQIAPGTTRTAFPSGRLYVMPVGDLAQVQQGSTHFRIGYQPNGGSSQTFNGTCLNPDPAFNPCYLQICCSYTDPEDFPFELRWQVATPHGRTDFGQAKRLEYDNGGWIGAYAGHHWVDGQGNSSGVVPIAEQVVGENGQIRLRPGPLPLYRGFRDGHRRQPENPGPY